MKTTLLPDPTELAQAFSRVLRQWLTAEQMREVVARNRAEQYGKGICASHDFCDANMAMLEAWESLSTTQQDCQSEEQARIWSAAWDIAKGKEFATQDAEFAKQTAIRIETYGGNLHGLAAVRAQANDDCTISLAVEYFQGDTERDGQGDAVKLFEHLADMGLHQADSDMPLAISKGAFGGVVEHFQVS